MMRNTLPPLASNDLLGTAARRLAVAFDVPNNFCDSHAGFR